MTDPQVAKLVQTRIQLTSVAKALEAAAHDLVEIGYVDEAVLVSGVVERLARPGPA